MFEETLSGTLKETGQIFAPKKAKRKGVKKVEKREEKAVTFSVEELGPTKTTKEGKVSSILKNSPAVIQVKGSVIQTPKQKIIAVSSLAVSDTEEVLERPAMTMAGLINDPMPDGKLSQRQIEYLVEVKEKKKTRKVKQEPLVRKEIKKIVDNQTPQMIMRNGEMVIDTNSMQVQEEPSSFYDDQEVIDEDAASRYVTSASFRTKRKQESQKWTAQMTQRFYDGLSYFGTDLKVISYMFPGITHQNIKAKNKTEEKKNAAKITHALMNRKKPPQKLKDEMLGSIGRKRDLEDSIYVNKRPRDEESIQDLVAEEHKTFEIKKDFSVKVNLDEIQEEKEQETNVSKVEPEEIVPLFVPELALATSSTVQKGTVNVNRKRKKQKVVLE